jgi:lauroyl/myristoyl acyltransferase
LFDLPERERNAVKLITVKDCYPLCVITLIQAANWVAWPKLRLLLVKAVACMAHRLSMTKRRLSENNVRQVFCGKLSEERIRTIVKSSFYEFWLEVFSMPPSIIPVVPLSQFDIRGLDHLQRAIDDGKGAILWESSHFGRRLLAKRILCQRGFGVHQVHGEYHMGGLPNNAKFVSWAREHFIRRFFENCECSFVREIIYITAPRFLAFSKILLKLLKQNGIICISADVPRGHKFIPVQFLGRTEFFPTGMVSLAKLSGAPILPLFCIQDNGSTPSLIIEPPVRLETDTDRESNLEKTVTQYARLLESYVMKYPEQYRNWHSLRPPLKPIP